MGAVFGNAKTMEVEKALLSAAAEVEQAGPGRWKMMLPQRPDLPVEVSLADDFVSFEASLDGRGPSLESDGIALLECNALLPAGLRSALRPRTRSLVRPGGRGGDAGRGPGYLDRIDLRGAAGCSGYGVQGRQVASASRVPSPRLRRARAAY